MMYSKTCPNDELVLLCASALILCLLFASLNTVKGEIETAELPKRALGDNWRFSEDEKPPLGMLGTVKIEITNDSYLLSQSGSIYECYEYTSTGSGQIYGDNESGTWTSFSKAYYVKTDDSLAKSTITKNMTHTYLDDTTYASYQLEYIYNPPLETSKGFPLSAGKGWSTSTTETKTTTFTINGDTEQYTNITTQTLEYLVIRTETARVSAGEFETFVIRLTYPDGMLGEHYYSPKARIDVKLILYDNTGKVISTMELLGPEGFPIIYVLAGAVVAVGITVGGLGCILSRRKKKADLDSKPTDVMRASEEETVPKHVCPNCKRLLDATWKACPYCGRDAVSKEEKSLPPICPRCQRLLDESWKACPYCGRSLVFTTEPLPSYEPSSSGGHDEFPDSPSAIWYVLPFLFGIIGGLIAYVGVKDRDKDMAEKLIIFSIIWSIILFVIGWWVWVTALYH